MNVKQPAIVIPVFKRLHTLEALLKSLESASYPSADIILVFRSHEGASEQVRQYCKDYQWPHGSKTCIHDPDLIDLDENLRRCGDLTETYQNIIILEDDSYVSPFFYEYAQQGLAHCEKEPSVAQVSLYRYCFHPISGLPHHLLDDEASNFYLQKTSTRGQAFSEEQWTHFRKWLKQMPKPDERLPAYIQSYGINNWELQHNWYLIEQKCYSLMPKKSVVSNTGAVGTHHNGSIDSGYFQAPMQTVLENYTFSHIGETSLIYDAFFEVHSQVFQDLGIIDVEIDLGGHKPIGLLSKEYTLTSKSCKEPIKSYDAGLKPLELNVLWNYKGQDINLCKTYNLVKDAKRESKHAAKQYFAEVVDIGLLNYIRFKWLKFVDRKRQKE